MYFAQRPIFEHSVSGVGNLPSHVFVMLWYKFRFHVAFQIAHILFNKRSQNKR